MLEFPEKLSLKDLNAVCDSVCQFMLDNITKLYVQNSIDPRIQVYRVGFDGFKRLRAMSPVVDGVLAHQVHGVVLL